jgi:hypothetical protein
MLDKIKETVASALAAYPPAALAFSGVCAAAPVSFPNEVGDETRCGFDPSSLE